jgi:hypothetical protein
MSIIKIKQSNEPKFLEDIKKVSDVMVYADRTNSFFRTTKREVMKEAETKEVRYYITNKVFANRRDVMVIF